MGWSVGSDKFDVQPCCTYHPEDGATVRFSSEVVDGERSTSSVTGMNASRVSGHVGSRETLSLSKWWFFIIFTFKLHMGESDTPHHGRGINIVKFVNKTVQW
jgi:hypothetical protein